MHCRHSRWSLGTTVLLTLFMVTAPSGQAETRRVPAGPEYERSGFHTFWWGESYRELWTTPIEVEVLDLQEEAGGLEVVRQVGGMQTPGLALKGADGKAYTFRSVHKDLARILPEEWRETLVARQVQDQNAANHPGVFPFVNGLAQNISWAAPSIQRLVVMPDDPVLGEYRELFAGKLGTFGEYPLPASDGHAGFLGASEILSSRKLWYRWLEGPETRVDTELFLRYRIADLWMGNWDRHSKQWRWANLPGKDRWRPIPEDPDQVFVDFQGVLLWLARWQFPKLVSFGDKISAMEGMTFNGADIDRWVLTDLDRSAFQRAAREVQAELTDEVIDKALKWMPAEWYAISGPDIAQRLKKRRDNLEEGIDRYYLRLAGEVNIHGTDRNESARVSRFDDGSVEVAVGLEGEDAPYYQRRFEASETRTVRIYLHGGNDQVVSEGPPKGRIKVLVIGGPGDDTLDDSHSGEARFYDFEGRNDVVKGKGTKVDTRPWHNPLPLEVKPWLEPRDFATWVKPVAFIGKDPDAGLILRAGFDATTWSFRKFPYDHTHRAVGGVSTGRDGAEFDYSGSFRMVNSDFSVDPQLLVSGLELLNFYGFGNETEKDDDLEDDEFYEVDENLVRFLPSINWRPRPGFEMFLGPELTYTEERSSDTLMDESQPYGGGDFGQLGLVLGLGWDSRGEEGPLYVSSNERQAHELKRTGIGLEFEGSVFPEIWDVEEVFGAVEGRLAGSLGLGSSERVVIAAQVGGRKVWGDFPWHEAAFVGGKDTLRGYAEQRFAGEEAAFGSVELRVRVLEGKFLFPGRVWLLGLADMGRVWDDGEHSNEWHDAYGGGAVVEMMATPIKMRLEVVRNDEEDSTSTYFSTGFAF